MSFRKIIVENFFQDILTEYSNETNKILLETNKVLLEKNKKLECYNNKDLIDKMRGRYFTQEENTEIQDILEIGTCNWRKD